MLVSRYCVIICEMPAMPDGNGRVMSFTVIKSRDDLSSNNFFCDAISQSYFASLSELLSFAAGHVYLSLLGFCASLHLSDSQQELEQVIFIAKNAPHNHEIYFQFKP